MVHEVLGRQGCSVFVHDVVLGFVATLDGILFVIDVLDPYVSVIAYCVVEVYAKHVDSVKP